MLRPPPPPPLFRPDALQATADMAPFLHPAMRNASDLPIGKLMHVRQLMHPIGYYDPFEQETAPEMVNPLLSQPLLELCLRCPTFILGHGGISRALERKAFEADLPREIVSRRAKGGTSEHMLAVLRRNDSVVKGMLLEGELARRGILDRTRVGQVLSDRPTVLQANVGLLHRLVGVEAWLGRFA